MLPDAISMEPFQQYLADTFPEDGKRSTSGVVHELRLDCQVTLALGKLPHVQKWLQYCIIYVTAFTIHSGNKPFSQLIISFPHQRKVYNENEVSYTAN